MYLKRQDQEQSSVDGAQSPHTGRHLLLTADCTNHSNETSDLQDVEVGSFYEVDHTNLPPRTPLQLRSIRLVMVCEKTDLLNVSVRFPSVESLRRYFSNGITERSILYPTLDEEFVMGTKLAGKVLFRQVPSQEFAEKKNLEGFWLVNTASNSCESMDVLSNKSSCFTELKCNGMVRWGVRRQVAFIGKHKENQSLSAASSFVEEEEKAKEEGAEEEEREEEEGEEEEREETEEGDEEEEEEDHGEEEANETKNSHKRKHSRSSSLIQKPKKVKRENRRQSKSKTKIINNYKQIVLRDPKNRWSTERYKLAEQNLLEVMKAKGAVYGKPILRPALREEARKRIGDTGLLDHLLKHMAGMVAPGGAERFRRRHNAEGAMEYWLESADLSNLRKEAGVEDPFWCPPPGWKLGDCPTQDPICARELKQLKEQTSKVERDMDDMVSKKQLEEELVQLRREMEEMLFNTPSQQQQSQTTVVSNSSVTSQKLNLDFSLIPLKSNQLDSSSFPLEKYKEQLMVISNFLSNVKEQIRKLTSKVEEVTKRSDSALIVSTESCAEKEEKKLGEEKGKALVVVQQRGGDQRKRHTAKVAGNTAAEEKAAKLQRLKSGFRICKPQGTFLWPNMVHNNKNTTTKLSPQVLVHVDQDLFVVPTPPSVSSSSTSAAPQLPHHHHHHHPASPVKPSAEKRAVKVAVSTVSKTPMCEVEDNSYSTTTTTSTTNNTTSTLINLNDLPTNPCETQSSPQTVTTTTTLTPRLLMREMSQSEMVGGCRSSNGSAGDYNKMSYSTQQQENSCLSMEVGTWLALGSPNPALDYPNRR